VSYKNTNSVQTLKLWAWPSVQVGRSRDRFPVSQGFFSVASDSSMYPGFDSASKNEYQVNPGGKGDRCVRLTTYQLHVRMSRNLRALTSWNPVGLFRPVTGRQQTLKLIDVQTFAQNVYLKQSLVCILLLHLYDGRRIFWNMLVNNIVQYYIFCWCVFVLLLTYLLTPWSRVLLEKLIVLTHLLHGAESFLRS
jgi:hypothetical protein